MKEMSRLPQMVRLGILLLFSWTLPGPTDAQLQRPDANTSSASYQIIPFSARLVPSDDLRFVSGGDMFLGGLQLVSRDPTLYSIAWINGFASGRLRDGRALVIGPHALGRALPNEIRVAPTIELAGGYPDRAGEINPTPANPPTIPGYRFIVSDSILPRHAIGLWQRIRGPDETLIVVFHDASGTEPASHTIVGRVSLRLGSIYLHGGLHIWLVNVVSEARVGRPIYVLGYELGPDRMPYGSRARRYDPGVRH
jgi:hypothetical protein